VSELDKRQHVGPPAIEARISKTTLHVRVEADSEQRWPPEDHDNVTDRMAGPPQNESSRKFKSNNDLSTMNRGMSEQRQLNDAEIYVAQGLDGPLGVRASFLGLVWEPSALSPGAALAVTQSNRSTCLSILHKFNVLHIGVYDRRSSAGPKGSCNDGGVKDASSARLFDQRGPCGQAARPRLAPITEANAAYRWLR
jgi:hypothetical protein